MSPHGRNYARGSPQKARGRRRKQSPSSDRRPARPRQGPTVGPTRREFRVDDLVKTREGDKTIQVALETTINMISLWKSDDETGRGIGKEVWERLERHYAWDESVTLKSLNSFGVSEFLGNAWLIKRQERDKRCAEPNFVPSGITPEDKVRKAAIFWDRFPPEAYFPMIAKWCSRKMTVDRLKEMLRPLAVHPLSTNEKLTSEERLERAFLYYKGTIPSDWEMSVLVKYLVTSEKKVREYFKERNEQNENLPKKRLSRLDHHQAQFEKPLAVRNEQVERQMPTDAQPGPSTAQPGPSTAQPGPSCSDAPRPKVQRATTKRKPRPSLRERLDKVFAILDVSRKPRIQVPQVLIDPNIPIKEDKYNKRPLPRYLEFGDELEQICEDYYYTYKEFGAVPHAEFFAKFDHHQDRGPMERWWADRAQYDREVGVPFPAVHPVPKSLVRLEKAWVFYQKALEFEQTLRVVAYWADIPYYQAKALVEEWNRRGLGLVETRQGKKTIRAALRENVSRICFSPCFGIDAPTMRELEREFAVNEKDQTAAELVRRFRMEDKLMENVRQWLAWKVREEQKPPTPAHDVSLKIKQVMCFWNNYPPEQYLQIIADWVGVRMHVLRSELYPLIEHPLTHMGYRPVWAAGIPLDKAMILDAAYPIASADIAEVAKAARVTISWLEGWQRYRMNKHIQEGLIDSTGKYLMEKPAEKFLRVYQFHQRIPPSDWEIVAVRNYTRSSTEEIRAFFRRRNELRMTKDPECLLQHLRHFSDADKAEWYKLGFKRELGAVLDAHHPHLAAATVPVMHAPVFNIPLPSVPRVYAVPAEGADHMEVGGTADAHAQDSDVVDTSAEASDASRDDVASEGLEAHLDISDSLGSESTETDVPVTETAQVNAARIAALVADLRESTPLQVFDVVTEEQDAAPVNDGCEDDPVVFEDNAPSEEHDPDVPVLNVPSDTSKERTEKAEVVCCPHCKHSFPFSNGPTTSLPSTKTVGTNTDPAPPLQQPAKKMMDRGTSTERKKFTDSETQVEQKETTDSAISTEDPVVANMDEELNNQVQVQAEVSHDSDSPITSREDALHSETIHLLPEDPVEQRSSNDDEESSESNQELSDCSLGSSAIAEDISDGTEELKDVVAEELDDSEEQLEVEHVERVVPEHEQEAQMESELNVPAVSEEHEVEPEPAGSTLNDTTSPVLSPEVNPHHSEQPDAQVESESAVAQNSGSCDANQLPVRVQDEEIVTDSPDISSIAKEVVDSENVSDVAEHKESEDSQEQLEVEEEDVEPDTDYPVPPPERAQVESESAAVTSDANQLSLSVEDCESIKQLVEEMLEGLTKEDASAAEHTEHPHPDVQEPFEFENEPIGEDLSIPAATEQAAESFNAAEDAQLDSSNAVEEQESEPESRCSTPELFANRDALVSTVEAGGSFMRRVMKPEDSVERNLMLDHNYAPESKSENTRDDTDTPTTSSATPDVPEVTKDDGDDKHPVPKGSDVPVPTPSTSTQEHEQDNRANDEVEDNLEEPALGEPSAKRQKTIVQPKRNRSSNASGNAGSEAGPSTSSRKRSATADIDPESSRTTRAKTAKHAEENAPVGSRLRNKPTPKPEAKPKRKYQFKAKNDEEPSTSTAAQEELAPGAEEPKKRGRKRKWNGKKVAAQPSSDSIVDERDEEEQEDEPASDNDGPSTSSAAQTAPRPKTPSTRGRGGNGWGGRRVKGTRNGVPPPQANPIAEQQPAVSGEQAEKDAAPGTSSAVQEDTAPISKTPTCQEPVEQEPEGAANEEPGMEPDDGPSTSSAPVAVASQAKIPSKRGRGGNGWGGKRVKGTRNGVPPPQANPIVEQQHIESGEQAGEDAVLQDEEPSTSAAAQVDTAPIAKTPTCQEPMEMEQEPEVAANEEPEGVEPDDEPSTSSAPVASEAKTANKRGKGGNGWGGRRVKGTRNGVPPPQANPIAEQQHAESGEQAGEDAVLQDEEPSASPAAQEATAPIAKTPTCQEPAVEMEQEPEVAANEEREVEPDDEPSTSSASQAKTPSRRGRGGKRGRGGWRGAPPPKKASQPAPDPNAEEQEVEQEEEAALDATPTVPIVEEQAMDKPSTSSSARRVKNKRGWNLKKAHRAPPPVPTEEPAANPNVEPEDAEAAANPEVEAEGAEAQVEPAVESGDDSEEELLNPVPTRSRRLDKHKKPPPPCQFVQLNRPHGSYQPAFMNPDPDTDYFSDC